MTLLLLLIVGGAGAGVAAWGGVRGGAAARVGAIAGMGALLAVLALALAIDATHVSDDPLLAAPSAAGLFDGHVVPTDYLRLVVALWALDGAIVAVIAWLLRGLPGLRGLLASTLAAIVGGTVALGATDLVLGVVAAAGTGLAALVVVAAAERGSAIPSGARELRVALGAGALLLMAIAVAPVAAALALGGGAGGGREAPGEAGAVIGLAALAITIGVAARNGAVPFHLRVPRLADVTPPAATPLLLAWIPLPLGVVGLGALDRLVAPLALPLDGERAIVLAFAVFTLCAAALAAFIQDDLRHSIGYLVIADGALVLLGLAALDPAAWGPTRVWLVALAASKTALGAWGAVAEARFETRSLPDLRGWIRRAPILAAALVLTIVASYGLPGWIALGARGELAGLAAGAPWDSLLVLAGFLTLPTYLRVLLIGTGPASTPVARAAPERIVRTRRPAEALPVEVEPPGAVAPVGATVGASTGTSTASSPAEGAAEEPAVEEPAAVRRLARASAATASIGARVAGVGPRVAGVVRRDRAELTSAAVLALAVLAVLTSWGALDIGRAAAEPAPIVAGFASD